MALMQPCGKSHNELVREAEQIRARLTALRNQPGRTPAQTNDMAVQLEAIAARLRELTAESRSATRPRQTRRSDSLSR
jgi:hypothetical protein